MKNKYFYFLPVLFAASLSVAQTNSLPPNVPSQFDINGRPNMSAITFTTKAYQEEALEKVIEEANQVAKELQLPNELPITKSNIVKSFIPPFGFAREKEAIGNITTSNYN